MSDNKLFMPFGVEYDLIKGIMKNPDKHLIRKASSMKGHYEDAAALDKIIAAGDPLHYEVFEKNIPEENGHLQFCISTTQPGLVGDECFMTKGHYHRIPETAEIYLCLTGRGYMLMKTKEGDSVAEEMFPGRMVYVPPYWAHRTVNTGDTPLTSFCVYPGNAGHNYGDIEVEGFPKRVYKRNGKIEISAWKRKS